MKVLTEAEIRGRIKKEQSNQLVVSSDTIITPSAREFLNEKKIQLVYHEEVKEEVKTENEKKDKEDIKNFFPKYICKETGGYFEKKPEHMTQLYGNQLVFKTHPSIIFRGKLDSLQAKILEVQVMAEKNKCPKLIEALQEVLQVARNILRAEVIKEEIDDISFFGFKEEDIRKMSHHPKEYLGIDHILPDYKMGEILIGLNAIRSCAREAELSGIPLEREDIIKALNRLSSAVYVMMCRYLTGFYN